VDDSKQVDDQRSVEAEEFAARRKVIKGMASVAPVIMTLGSGEVLANSSNLQCIEKNRHAMPQKCLDKDEHGIWESEDPEWLRKLKWRKKQGDEYKKCNPDYDHDCVQKKCLVYVDESGHKLRRSEGGMPITKSCYNSFLSTK